MATTARPRQRRFVRVVLGLGALFSGVALLAHILAGIALPLGLALTGGLLALGGGLAWRRTPVVARRQLARRLGLGVGVGVAATVTYDLTKYLLALWDPSPYNPFEAIRIFGLLLTGPTAPAGLSLAAGVGFHLLNGVAFGTAYCFLFGERGIIAGIAWGIFLELFQLTLYPGWLDIRAYDEFVRISALSHVVYGAVLGWGCRAGMWGVGGRVPVVTVKPSVPPDT